MTDDTSSEDNALEFLATRDLNLLKPEERPIYLINLHKAMGISPWIRAFDFLNLDGKTILYANRTAADQLAKQADLSSEVVYAGPLRLGDKTFEELFTVELRISMPDPINIGRTLRSIVSVGAVAVGSRVKGKDGDTVTLSQGDALANAYMKAYTKAWRRGVLQIMGCGMVDESETDTIPRSNPSIQPQSTPQVSVAPPTPRVLEPNAGSKVIDIGAELQKTEPAKTPRPLPAARPPR